MHAQDKFNLWIAFAIGAVLGAVLGTVRGTLVYGFDIGFLFNHILGGFFLGGGVFFVLAVLINWFRRRPV